MVALIITSEPLQITLKAIILYSGQLDLLYLLIIIINSNSNQRIIRSYQWLKPSSQLIILSNPVK
jgi:hypothetical protein